MNSGKKYDPENGFGSCEYPSDLTGVSAAIYSPYSRNVYLSIDLSKNKLNSFNQYISGIYGNVPDSCFEDISVVNETGAKTLLISGNNAKLIGKRAFYNSNKYKTIAWPSILETIGTEAFAGKDDGSSVFYFKSTNLEENDSIIKFPAKLKELGDKVFYHGLNHDLNISLDFSDCSELSSIPDFSFYLCEAETITSFPPSLSAIGNYAFGDSNYLSSIPTFPSSLSSLGTNAFSGQLLESIDFGENKVLKQISENAFFGCTSLSTANLPINVETIEDGAFQKTALTGITLVSTLTDIGIGAFQETNLLEIEIPNNVNNIDISAFSGCSELKTVKINRYDSALTAVTASCFEKCNNLSSFVFPVSRMNSIGENAFNGCNNLSVIYIPENIGILGNNSFQKFGIPLSLFFENKMEELSARNDFTKIGTNSYLSFDVPLSSFNNFVSGISPDLRID